MRYTQIYSGNGLYLDIEKKTYIIRSPLLITVIQTLRNIAFLVARQHLPKTSSIILPINWEQSMVFASLEPDSPVEIITCPWLDWPHRSGWHGSNVTGFMLRACLKCTASRIWIINADMDAAENVKHMSTIELYQISPAPALAWNLSLLWRSTGAQKNLGIVV